MTGGDGFIVVLPRRATARSLASYGACAAVARPVNAEGLPIGTNTSDVTRLSAIRCRAYAYAANTPPAGGGVDVDGSLQAQRRWHVSSAESSPRRHTGAKPRWPDRAPGMAPVALVGAGAAVWAVF